MGKTTRALRIAVTAGDPFGIGPEVALAALDAVENAEVTLYGDPEILAGAPNVVAVPVEGERPERPGPSAAGGKAALAALNRALEAAVDDFARLKAGKRGWAVLGPGYALTYGQCRKELERWRASKRPEDSHRLRRFVKYLGFQLMLLEAANPEAIGRQTAALKDLGHRLGRLHDCTNLEILMRDKKVKRQIPAEHRKQIRRAARAWERDLTRECLPLAEPLFASTPEKFTSRLEHDWQRARQPQRPASTA